MATTRSRTRSAPAAPAARTRAGARTSPGKPTSTAASKRARTAASGGKRARTAASTATAGATAPRPRVFGMSFASVYPLYVQKATKKGRTQAEVDEVIGWLTGYRGARLQQALDDRRDLEAFFARAPRWSPKAGLITGVVCGVWVEEVADPLMQKIRYLDKLVDELAAGKAMATILRA